jgi:hypothetical protein
MLDFIIGGVTGTLMVFGYWTVLALYDWFDGRQARRIRRAAAKQFHP